MCAISNFGVSHLEWGVTASLPKRRSYSSPRSLLPGEGVSELWIWRKNVKEVRKNNSRGSQIPPKSQLLWIFAAFRASLVRGGTRERRLKISSISPTGVLHFSLAEGALGGWGGGRSLYFRVNRSCREIPTFFPHLTLRERSRNWRRDEGFLPRVPPYFLVF
jgi:hypothetical protein